jgi:hypothetical protein
MPFGKPKGKTPREDLNVDDKIILKWIEGNGNVDLVYVALDSNYWRTLVNTKMNDCNP